MAELEHNLSLADALTEPPPEIEEEVKRDFIATLEAEKFDDVVGETVDKTDYVPLLDDDEDGTAGSQEPRSKAHADAVHGEHTSAAGPMVVENGDHGLGNNGTAFPGGVLDESLSYEEFFARSAAAAMDDRDLCFEPQPVFKPVEMADPFGVHRGEPLPDLAFPADMQHVPMFGGHVGLAGDIHAHASMMVPDQAFLGPPYSPAEVLDPSAFIGLDSAAEYLQDTAGPAEHWLGAPHAAAGPGAAFFAEPPVPAEEPRVPASPAPPAEGEAGAAAAPRAAAPDAGAVPAAAVVSVPAEAAGSLPGTDAEPPAAVAPAAGALLAHAAHGAFAPAAEAASPGAADAAFAPGAEGVFAPAADPKSPHAAGLEFAPAAAGAGLASPAHPQAQHAADSAFAPAEGAGFAPPADALSHHAMDLAFAPTADTPAHCAVGLAAADAAAHHAVDLAFAPATDTPAHHAVDLATADTPAHHAVDLATADTPARYAVDLATADAAAHHAVDLAFIPTADPAAHHAMDLATADPAAHHAMDLATADPAAHHAMDSVFAPAADPAAHHAVDLATADPAAHHAMDLAFAPAAEASHLHATASAFSPAAEAKAPPAADAAFAPVPAGDVKAAALEELVTPEREEPPVERAPAEAPANPEQELKAPEACAALPSEKAKGAGSSPGRRAERLPENSDHLLEAAAPVEAKEATALENKEPLPEKPVTAAELPVPEKPKEEAEHNHLQHAEPQQEEPLQESPGARRGHAPKRGERRAGSADAAAAPAGPDERLVGSPRPKSPGPARDPLPVAGSAPRPRVSHKKEQPARALPELAESCGDVPRESWDAEGSSVAMKKKKKKPKQKRNQQPRAVEFWEENISPAPKTCPFAFGLQKPDIPPVLPAEARKEHSMAPGNGALDTAKDAKITAGSLILGNENAFPVPGEQALKGDLLVASVLDAKSGGFAKAEGVRGDSWMSQSNGTIKQAPLEPMEKAEKRKVGDPVPVKAPTPPAPITHPNGKNADKEAGCSGPTASPSTGSDPRKVETPLETKPSESALSANGREAASPAPKHGRGSEAVPAELPASNGSSEKEAKKRAREKSKEAANESFKQPHLLEPRTPLDRLAVEANPADKAKTGLCAEVSAPQGAPEAAPAAPAPAPLAAPAPGEAVPSGGRKAGGFPEQTPLPAAPSDAREGPSAAEAAPSPGRSREPGFAAPQPAAAKEPGFAQGMDKPRKRRGEGRGKKARGFPEQVPFPEDGSNGERKVDEPLTEMTFPDKGKENGFAARGHPSAAAAHSYAAKDKAKKRGSDGRSKKGERGFFQQPFLPEGKRDAGGSPDVMERPKETSVGTGGSERGCASAGHPRESISEAAPAPPEEADAVDRGREAGFTPPGQAVVMDLGATLADKPRKRSSDGKRKNEKAPFGQPAGPESRADAGPLPSMEERAGKAKEVSFAVGKSSELEGESVLEGQAGVAEELQGKPEAQGGERKSCSGELDPAGQETEPAKPETVKTKETWPTSKETEVVVSPSEPAPESRPKKKGRDVKGRKAEREHPAAPAAAKSPAGAAGAGAGNGQESEIPVAGSRQAPAAALEPGEAGAGNEQDSRRPQDALEQALPSERSGAGRAAGPEAGGSAAAEGGRAPERDRSKKRGSEGRSQKARGASEQRGAAEAAASGEEGRAAPEPLRVDENSNVCGPRAAAGSCSPALAGAAGHAPPGFPTAAAGEELPVHGAELWSGSEGPAGSGEQRPGRAEPGKGAAVHAEGSAGEPAAPDERETGTPPPAAPPVGEDTRSSKDEAPLPAVATVGAEDARRTEERQEPGCSSTVPLREATGTASGTAPGGAGVVMATEGTVPAIEGDVAHGSLSAPVPTESGVTGEMEPPGDGKGHQGLPKDADGLGASAGGAEAAGLDLLAAQPAPISHEERAESSSGPAEAARHAEAAPEGVPAADSAAEKPGEATKEWEEEPAEQTAKAAKQDGAAKGKEQLRGYLRPTKARGAPGAAGRDKAKAAGAAAAARPRPHTGVCSRAASLLVVR